MPVACIFLHFNSKTILASSYNKTNRTKNATTHSEINCIDEIYSKIETNQLSKQFNLEDSDSVFTECVLFVSCEPCIMCAYALSLISNF